MSQLLCALAASLRRCLHSHEQRAIVIGLPLLLGCHCCWVAIVVRPPSLLGCHHCRAAIAASFPRATSKQPIFVGLHCRPFLLGCLQTLRLLSLGCRHHPVPSCATNCLCTWLTPVTFSYATIAFCCSHVYQPPPPCHDGKLHVCPTAP